MCFSFWFLAEWTQIFWAKTLTKNIFSLCLFIVILLFDRIFFLLLMRLFAVFDTFFYGVVCAIRTFFLMDFSTVLSWLWLHGMAQAFTLSFYLIKIRKFLSIYYIHRIQQFFSLSNFVAAWCQNMNIWAEKIKQIVVEMLVKVFFFILFFFQPQIPSLFYLKKQKTNEKEKKQIAKKLMEKVEKWKAVKEIV